MQLVVTEQGIWKSSPKLMWQESPRSSLHFVCLWDFQKNTLQPLGLEQYCILVDCTPEAEQHHWFHRLQIAFANAFLSQEKCLPISDSYCHRESSTLSNINTKLSIFSKIFFFIFYARLYLAVLRARRGSHIGSRPSRWNSTSLPKPPI